MFVCILQLRKVDIVASTNCVDNSWPRLTYLFENANAGHHCPMLKPSRLSPSKAKPINQAFNPKIERGEEKVEAQETVPDCYTTPAYHGEVWSRCRVLRRRKLGMSCQPKEPLLLKTFLIFGPVKVCPVITLVVRVPEVV